MSYRESTGGNISAGSGFISSGFRVAVESHGIEIRRLIRAARQKVFAGQSKDLDGEE
jgi:hypothetical protein